VTPSLSGWTLLLSITTTLSQLKHSNVRTPKPKRAELVRTSIIGARQFAQGWLSILLDVKQKSDSDAGKLLSFDQSYGSIANWKGGAHSVQKLQRRSAKIIQSA